jgi:hypothetical protein
MLLSSCCNSAGGYQLDDDNLMVNDGCDSLLVDLEATHHCLGGRY